MFKTTKLIIEEDDTEIVGSVVEKGEMSIIDNIIESSYTELNNMMDSCCKNYEANFSGGEMRGYRGDQIENYVKNVIHMFNENN